jgi:hypothetical protein
MFHILFLLYIFFSLLPSSGAALALNKFKANTALPSGTWGSVALTERLNPMQHLFDVSLLRYEASFINHFSPNHRTIHELFCLSSMIWT